MIQMHVLFRAQDVLDLVNDSYTPVAENANRSANNYATRNDEEGSYGVVLYPSVCGYKGV